MRRKRWIGATIVALGALSASGARAQDASAVSLSSADFAFTLSRVDASGNTTVLSADDLATYFSVARCACPTTVTASLSLDSTTAATLGTHTVDAQLVVGSDCDVVTTTTCTSVGGTLTLSSEKLATTQSIATPAIFAGAGDAACATTTSSTRLWAIVRLDGARLTSEPSLALTLGGAGPKAPTAVKAVSAEQGLLVSWTESSDATTLLGHQVLCSPGAATASTAGYDTCGAATPDGGTGPFATLDPQLLCSDVVPVGTNSVRVHGLEDGRAYEIAVVAIGVDGTPSAPSTPAQGTPAPTVGLEDLYHQEGGTAQAGCEVAGSGTPAGSVLVALVAMLALAGRRRRTLVLMVAGLSTFAARAAHAETDGLPLALTASDDAALTASPRAWNLELRFGPYRPNIDAEFAARGVTARPFEQLFGTSPRLMMQLEIDRQLLRRAGGTWAVGLGVGYYHATAAALEADLKTPSGDQTGLRLIPLSAALVYRADGLRERFGSPLVPYAKAGLDCTLWRMTDTSQSSADGRTYGWHAAAGVSLDLSMLDPEAAHTMDRESGVNQTALFFEVARYDLDGFGAGQALHVGDTTWFGGLMLEL